MLAMHSHHRQEVVGCHCTIDVQEIGAFQRFESENQAEDAIGCLLQRAGCGRCSEFIRAAHSPRAETAHEKFMDRGIRSEYLTGTTIWLCGLKPAYCFLPLLSYNNYKLSDVELQQALALGFFQGVVRLLPPPVSLP